MGAVGLGLLQRALDGAGAVDVDLVRGGSHEHAIALVERGRGSGERGTVGASDPVVEFTGHVAGHLEGDLGLARAGLVAAGRNAVGDGDLAVPARLRRRVVGIDGRGGGQSAAAGARAVNRDVLPSIEGREDGAVDDLGLVLVVGGGADILVELIGREVAVLGCVVGRPDLLEFRGDRTAVLLAPDPHRNRAFLVGLGARGDAQRRADGAGVVALDRIQRGDRGQEQLDVLDVEFAEIIGDVVGRGLDHRIADDLDVERVLARVIDAVRVAYAISDRDFVEDIVGVVDVAAGVGDEGRPHRVGERMRLGRTVGLQVLVAAADDGVAVRQDSDPGRRDRDLAR